MRRGVTDMGPNDVGLFHEAKTGVTTIQFGRNRIPDAVQAIRCLAVLYEEHNENPENSHRKIPQDTIKEFWKFLMQLQGTEVVDTDA